jgi:uncharacterized protein YndB with AHSA1/START domain
MSCNDSDRPEFDPEFDAVVERHVELPAPPEAVWAELPEMLGDDVDLAAEPGGLLRAYDPDGDRVGVVIEAVPAERLTFRWTTVDGDDPPSEVEISLEPSGVGTILHVRETRLDGARLERSAFSAHARV